jgi:type II secretory pathway pseudopilin PulG
MSRTMPRGRFSHGEAGFSFIEVVISGLLLLVIAVSVLPLFTEAAASNELGRESTQVANLARSRAEELLQLPFNAPQLTVTSGTELATDEYYSALNKRWLAGTRAEATGDRALWLRHTTIRQYSVTNLARLDSPLPAGTPPAGIHIKEILVEVRGATVGTLFGPSKNLTVRMLKAK